MDDYLGAASMVASAAMQAAGNSRSMKRAFEYNKELNNQQFEHSNELAQKNYERNLQQWQLENEYNTPKAQMQRNMEAGINPLWNGMQSTAASSPQLNTIPETGGSGISATSQNMIPNVLQMFMSFKTQQLQQDQLRADIESKEQMANNYRALASLNDSKNSQLLSSSDWWTQNAMYDSKARHLGALLQQERWLSEMFRRLNIQPEQLRNLKADTTLKGTGDLLQKQLFEYNKEINPYNIKAQQMQSEILENKSKYDFQEQQFLDKLFKGDANFTDFLKVLILGIYKKM